LGKRDPRVDAYIGAALPFARPVLVHLRRLIHAACPEVEETMKLGIPHFMYGGVLCSMAAFKQHCGFDFSHPAMRKITGPPRAKGDMGQFGRIWSKSDLPSEPVLTRYIIAAAKLNAKKIKRSSMPTSKKLRAPLPIPPDFGRALRKNAMAAVTFSNFPEASRREYLEWLSEAKRSQTRATRLAAAIALLAEGKTLNWKPAPKSRSR
jgi:hypothetical protein